MRRIELDYIVRYVICTAQFSYDFLFESYTLERKHTIFNHINVIYVVINKRYYFMIKKTVIVFIYNHSIIGRKKYNN